MPTFHEAPPLPRWLAPQLPFDRRIAELGDQQVHFVDHGTGPVVLMFHGNLVHGSAGNITPFPRKIVYLTLNACSNAIQKPTREEWLAHQDFRPIQKCADDALIRYAREHREVA